ncbi:unnamed protein product, partial [Mesorhabditis belari]|uniref:Uncharacterized protein n=1 Tax=Mesorhabditis belari TaxID=2138241 RepID=A0AAF3FCR7_9BILA
MSQRKIVVFNADDETMMGDVISATKTVFANSRKRQTRKVMDFPDDLADSDADEGPATNEIDQDESLTVEEMSHLKKGNRTLDSIFKRLSGSNKKKVPVRVQRASIVPRITHHRRATITKSTPKHDDGSMTWDEDETENYDPDVDGAIDDQEFEAEEYEDLDRPRVQETFEEKGPIDKHGLRLVYVDGKTANRPKLTRSTANYTVPTRFKAPRARILGAQPFAGNKRRVHVPIANRISFANGRQRFTLSDYEYSFDDNDKQGFRRGFSRKSNRTIGGRIRRREWPTPKSKWDEAPIKAWARDKLQDRSDEGERFKPWLKCACNTDDTHTHKGRGFTMSGRLHAFD